MNQNALISVIVPVYNTEQYLEKCINSIIDQTYRNLEIILVDDGSTDASGSICDSYLSKDERIVVVHQSNTGQAGARNHGISIARGEYIGFVDSDDWIASEMYETLLSCLKSNNADISICGRFSVVDGIVKESSAFRLEEITVMDTQEAVKRFLTYKAIDSSSCDKLYKKELLEGISYPLGYICEDVPFVYSALANSKIVVHCARPFYYCLHRTGSTSRSRFSPRTMGIYHHFKSVSERAKTDFPNLVSEADYIYYKNILVLATIIASEKMKVSERNIINAEIRRDIKKIMCCNLLKAKYKIFALAILFRMERILIKLAALIGVKI